MVLVWHTMTPILQKIGLASTFAVDKPFPASAYFDRQLNPHVGLYNAARRRSTVASIYWQTHPSAYRPAGCCGSSSGTHRGTGRNPLFPLFGQRAILAYRAFLHSEFSVQNSPWVPPPSAATDCPTCCKRMLTDPWPAEFVMDDRLMASAHAGLVPHTASDRHCAERCGLPPRAVAYSARRQWQNHQSAAAGS